ncbi:RNA-guided endonuclease InsQ/TnpB family protein [Iningainema tapete]|uniref:IS200/IS605 family element transposase accessory protein TnpB n=1 Tax=Iningainema tapete BLCC-T55 TaxID=2748662 RepID=A0A8J7BWG7_9CYAN|nr:RNA-guided endonuclease TnpB family protein [Iningainema tapete]MBD2771782.1 IS200/IS605 family element transposase accessory protein TnpB [Iningainema tapete BLCC-T55]
MFAVKRKLKLNKQEESILAQHAGFSRFVYNYGLDLFWQSIDVKASDSKRIREIKKCFTNITKKRPEYEWTLNLSSTVYQSAFQHLQLAFSNWRKGISKAPVFKSKKDGQSFTVYNCNGVSIVPTGKKIKLPSLGTFRLQERLKESNCAQTFTISKEADGWYVSFSVEAEHIPPIMHEIVEPIGIDLGVKTFATISDRTTLEAPLPYKEAKAKLGRFQYHNRNKQFGNRKKGIQTSNNAKKYFQKLAKRHQRIANKRKDFLHKSTTRICKKYAHVRIEDLNVAGMIANSKLSKAVSDLGFYEFRRQLEYKAPVFGTKLDIVDRWYPSSKQCRMCKQKNDDLKLSDRIFVCLNPACGHTEDRDLHAALNLAQVPEEHISSRVGTIRT